MVTRGPRGAARIFLRLSAKHERIRRATVGCHMALPMPAGSLMVVGVPLKDATCQATFKAACLGSGGVGRNSLVSI